MKYYILINQVGIVEAGLHTKTDMVDWAIIDYLQQWYFSERKKTIFNTNDNNHYVWVNYNHLIQEMPMLGIKDKHAISHRLKKLKNLNLIKTFCTKDNTLYFILTPFCIDIIGFKSTKTKKYENEHPLVMENAQPGDGKCTPPGDGKCIAQTYNHIKQKTNNIDNIDSNSIQFSNENFMPASPETSIVFDEETYSFKGIEPFINKWREAYPAVNLESKIKQMESWVMAQPKTRWKKNWKRFIMNWLSREQEKAEMRSAHKQKKSSFLDD